VFLSLVQFRIYELINTLEFDTVIMPIKTAEMFSLFEIASISSWCFSLRCVINSSSSMSLRL